ncbi:MAG: aminopeptidase P family protein [Candidatus Omnitrophica bacterium]|nr:aminopeptidase P family protein [Candidatus Omnitrophota bacterium]
MSKQTLLIYDSSESNPDLLYATRFFAPDVFLYLRTAGRGFMYVGDLEVDRAREEAHVNRVISFSDVIEKVRAQKGNRYSAADLIDSILRQRRIRHVTLPGNAPVALVEGLKKRRYAVRIKALPFFEKRIIKTPKEIRQIRRVAAVAESAMGEAIRIIAAARIKGRTLWYQGRVLTAEYIKSVVASIAALHDCNAGRTIVACGKDTAFPHKEGKGPLRPHEPIILDIFPRSQSTGFYADMSRTVVRGKASETIQRMYRAVLRAQRDAVRNIHSGADGKVLYEKVCGYFVTKGFRTAVQKGRFSGFFHSLGHGVGLELHETVRLDRRSYILKSGMVVTVEPGLYYPEPGGVRIEDMVLVTRTGCRPLTRAPKMLEL